MPQATALQCLQAGLLLTRLSLTLDRALLHPVPELREGAIVTLTLTLTLTLTQPPTPNPQVHRLLTHLMEA